MHHAIIEAIASHMKPDVYVELGIAVCGTLNRVVPHAKEVYACDLAAHNLGNIHEPERVNFYAETTDLFAERWKRDVNKAIDLCFIDADHSFSAVKKDVANFLPFLKTSTGLMLLHDTWPPTPEHTSFNNCGDCFKIKEWLRDLNKKEYFSSLEIVTIPAQFGLTIIRKRGEAAWQEGMLDE